MNLNANRLLPSTALFLGVLMVGFACLVSQFIGWQYPLTTTAGAYLNPTVGFAFVIVAETFHQSFYDSSPEKVLEIASGLYADLGSDNGQHFDSHTGISWPLRYPKLARFRRDDAPLAIFAGQIPILIVVQSA